MGLRFSSFNSLVRFYDCLDIRCGQSGRLDCQHRMVSVHDDIEGKGPDVKGRAVADHGARDVSSGRRDDDRINTREDSNGYFQCLGLRFPVKPP